MVAPSGEGAVRCMQQAMATVDAPIDYINTHGTSTPVGDLAEIKAIKEVFVDKIPPLSSSKSLAGHSLGASGVQECIYSLMMMENNFIQASANITTMDEDMVSAPIVTKRMDKVELNTILSNNFGFGGTNACLIMQRFK